MAERHVVHAYGVVPRGALDALGSALESVTGIGGTPVRVVELEQLAVVVGELPEGTFGEAIWREHAEDPQWLEPVARGHHEVLQEVARTSDVLPLRLPGIYAGEEELSTLLGLEQAALAERLEYVSGHDEWGVHVYLVAESVQPAAAPPASGRDYLLQRKRQVADRDVARDERQRLITDAYASLDEAATSSVLNRPQDRALSGRDEPMLLNSAHLVQREGREGFFARADEVSRRLLEPAGMVMELSGPWPPYNFAAPQQPVEEP